MAKLSGQEYWRDEMLARKVRRCRSRQLGEREMKIAESQAALSPGLKTREQRMVVVSKTAWVSAQDSDRRTLSAGTAPSFFREISSRPASPELAWPSPLPVPDVVSSVYVTAQIRNDGPAAGRTMTLSAWGRQFLAVTVIWMPPVPRGV